ncbi:hypothetical protein P9A91_10350 [Bacillus safensis]|uniref:hypothetical protein n=1 Tax=Bacillus safensis TaxID=561879 RepID=UPI002DBADD96|nr:hypothetical protein [Bacillus safensis]MEC1078415.1 hypothetical protein [Bacillus safensis]
MNWMELLSSIINSIAWPVAIIIIIWFLKKPISELINTIISIKYKDFEIHRDLNNQANSIQENTDSIVTSEDPSVLENLMSELSNYHTIEQLNDELDKKVFDLYLVSQDPRKDISFSHPSHYIQSTTFRASYLHSQEIITEDMYKVIHDLKDMFDKIEYIDNKTMEYPKKKYQENAPKIIAVLDKKIKEIQSETSSS